MHHQKREACSQIIIHVWARQMAARGSTPPNHAACIASSSPQRRIRCCHHCGPSAALEHRSRHQLDAPEHTQLRRCSNTYLYTAPRSNQSVQSFLSLRRAGPPAAASPELLFYLSPVTRLSPMNRRSMGPSCILARSSHRLANYTEPFFLPQDRSIIFVHHAHTYQGSITHHWLGEGFMRTNEAN